MADLSAVPGAGRIVEIAHQLAADPGALGAAGAQWRAAGAAATSVGDVVASKTSALDGAWDGAGADAVVDYATQLRTAFAAVVPATKSVSTALERAEHALTSAHSAVGVLTDKVAAAVAALPKPLGEHAGQMEYEQAVARIVGPAVGEAENAMNTAVNALQEATAQIAAACGATPFRSLPPIGEQPFEPARFTANTWQAHPVPETDTASQATGVAPGPRGLSATAGGGGGDLGGAPPAGGGTAAPAQVQQWIDQAIEILRAQGVPVDKMSREDIWTIIEHESGGDPHAINNWDSNAAQGTPSKGLMQCIGPTFASNALPGHGDIWNPVDNIIAGVRYSISRYGSVSNVPGVTGVHGGGSYVGY